jgi:hypothetical protein
MSDTTIAALTISLRAVIAWGFFASLALLLLSIVLTVLLLVRLPADSFVDNPRSTGEPAKGVAVRIGKNIFGWLLIVIGLILSIPGVPGQGIMTVLLGLLLVEFPGRRALIRRILRRKMFRRSIDRIRIRFGSRPLEWNDDDWSVPSEPAGYHPVNDRRPAKVVTQSRSH